MVMSDEEEATFRYVYSYGLDKRIQIKIGNLEGIRENQQRLSFEKLLEAPSLRFSGLYAEKCAPFMIRLHVFEDDKEICLPATTSFKAFKLRWEWNEWVTLPLFFSDLTLKSVLVLTIYDCVGPDKENIIGGTTISFFSKNGKFRQGHYDLRVWPDVEGDGNILSTTPGKNKDAENKQRQRLAKLSDMYHNGQMAKLDWLDRLTFVEISRITKKEKEDSNYLYLTIEFPTAKIDDKIYTIVHYEDDGDITYTCRSKVKLVTIPDPEIGKENLFEAKHHKLARSARSGLSDKDATPTATERDILEKIIEHYPPTHILSSEEQDVLWKYRFYIKNRPNALTKFLKCISWKSETEVKQALELLDQWHPIDVVDALELLTPSFKHRDVRMYAISRLSNASDDDLFLYMEQLVQALKYENFENIFKLYSEMEPEREKDIIKSLEYSAEQYSTVECLPNSDEVLTSTQQFTGDVQSVLEETNIFLNPTNEDSDRTFSEKLETAEISLASFLIKCACRNPKLAYRFYWLLSIECEDFENRKQNDNERGMYVTVLKMLLKTLTTGSKDLQCIEENLRKQRVLVDGLDAITKMVAKESSNRKKKTEKFQQLLSDVQAFNINFLNFEPRPLPLDPNVWVKGIIPEKVTLFKSALMPSKLSFITDKNGEYVAIFKHGDDLRQDQLILQMITLMDNLWKKQSIDLKLTPYKVLATSSKHGFMQFIDSYTVADVLATEGSILNFFRKHNPSNTGPYGIIHEVMDSYIRSCAGYCIITYVLGVGDRHLDNLLLTTSGNLFHIDFGYILGRDPKPMPPPMKLSKEMIEGMGGPNSEHHSAFRKQCYTAFIQLRRHAKVILNLFSLMVDASVPDIALEPDKAVKKVEENLKLKLSDEEAVKHLQDLLELSVSAVMPALVEQIHKFAQYWRK